MRMNPFCLTCLIQSQELQIRNFEDEEKKLRYMKEILGYLSASDPDASAPALVKSISRIYENYWGKKDSMEEAKKDLTTPKYFISEIFIKKEHAKNIQDLVDNLRKDPRFELYAMQFSESPTASSGGKLGWVNYGKLNVPIETALNSLKEGEISDPIAYADGYFIFKLDKVFDPKKDKPQMPTREEIINYLQNQRMEETSRQYLAELRTQAVIDIRN